jgi:hypothetical protein
MSENFSVAELDGSHVELLPARTVLSVMFSTDCGCNGNGNGCDGNAGFGFNQGACAGDHHNSAGFAGFGNTCGRHDSFGFGSGQASCADDHNGGSLGGGTPWFWSQVKNFCSQWWPAR